MLGNLCIRDNWKCFSFTSGYAEVRNSYLFNVIELYAFLLRWLVDTFFDVIFFSMSLDNWTMKIRYHTFAALL